MEGTDHASPSLDPSPGAQSRRPFSYLRVFRATPYERVELIRAGTRAKAALHLLLQFGRPSDLILQKIGASRASVARRALEDQALSLRASEQFVGLMQLVGQVEAMVGSAEGFDAPSWLAIWLTEPVAALGNQMPVELVDTFEGRQLNSNLLAQFESSAYA